MELILLDKNFEVCGLIEKYTSLQWIRRYYDVGTFELHTALSYFPLLDKAQYIYHNTAGETAIIEDISYTKTVASRTDLILKGRFLESLLADRVIDKTVILKGSLENELCSLVKQLAMSGDRAIPRLELSPAKGFTAKIEMQATGDNLMEKLYSVLQQYQMSFYITYNYLDNLLGFGIWQGKDRTLNQNENGVAILSDSFENILDTTFSRNSTEYKNVAYVAGAGEGNERLLEIVNRQKEGEARREVYVDARDLQPKREDGTEIPENEYRAMLNQRGLEKLEEFKQVEVIDGKIDLHSNLKYRVDFDLGDLCEYNNAEIGLSVQKRLTEVREIYEGGRMQLDTIFGEDYVQNIKKIVKRLVD